MQRRFPILAQARIDIHLVGELRQPADISLARRRQKIALPALSALIEGEPEQHCDNGKN